MATPKMKDVLRQHDFVYEKAPEEWRDGIPMANGDMGVMIWGDGAPLHVALDQGNVWELREYPRDPKRFNYKTLREMIAAGDNEKLLALFDAGHRDGKTVQPTRLPMPKMVIDFGEGAKNFNARLELHDAVTRGGMKFAAGTVEWTAFVHSDHNLFVFDYTRTGRAAEPEARISLERFDAEREPGRVEYWGARTLREQFRNWGHPEPVISDKGDVYTYAQTIPGNGTYTIALAQRSSGRRGA